MDDFEVKRLSDYKKEGKTNWANRQSNDRRQTRQGPTQCGGCGAHRERMQIHIKQNMKVTVMNVCTPRKTPLAYLEAAKKKIDDDVKLGIIEKVEGVAEWCSPMSFVPKPNGDIRSVVDLVQLNKHVDRPTHPFPAPKEIIARIPKTSKYFAV